VYAGALKAAQLFPEKAAFPKTRAPDGIRKNAEQTAVGRSKSPDDRDRARYPAMLRAMEALRKQQRNSAGPGRRAGLLAQPGKRIAPAALCAAEPYAA
jgi:hypothetical protein